MLPEKEEVDVLEDQVVFWNSAMSLGSWSSGGKASMEHDCQSPWSVLVVLPLSCRGPCRIVSESAETSEAQVAVMLVVNLDLHNLREEDQDASSSVAGNH